MDRTYPSVSPILTALILASLFRITKTSPEARLEMSNPPIGVGADTELEVETGSHHVKEGDVGSKEEVPLPLQGYVEASPKVELTRKIEEQLGSDGTPIEASNKHGEASATMAASSIMAMGESRSSVVVETSPTSSGSLAFIEELPATIEFVGPTIAVLVPLVRISPPRWVTEEGSSNILKAGGSMLDATPSVDVAALPHMLMEETLASLHHYATKIDGISLEGHGHNICWIMTFLVL